MLHWLSRTQSDGNNQTQSQGYVDSNLEPPETPAHLFAVKAFKTALFGTPAPATFENAVCQQPRQERFTSEGRLDKKDGKAEIARQHWTEEKNIIVSQVPNALASPTKGILLTPGTGPVRRKTVSFGASTLQEIKQAEPLCYISAANSDTQPSETRENADGGLRRSLFMGKANIAARPKKQDEDSEEVTPSDAVGPRLQKTSSLRHSHDLQPSNQTSDFHSQDTPNPENTIDLTDPRSISGKHWQREYQREHDNSKLEMKKLIQHSQVIKSYANERDEKAINLARKLEEAEQRIKELETRVSDLASQLIDARNQGHQLEDVLGELTTQTAQVLRYKQKCDRYKAALIEKLYGDGPTSLPQSTSQNNNYDASESTRLRKEKPTKSLDARGRARIEELEMENDRLKKLFATEEDHKVQNQEQPECCNVTKATGRKDDNVQRSRREKERAVVQSRIMREMSEPQQNSIGIGAQTQNLEALSQSDTTNLQVKFLKNNSAQHKKNSTMLEEVRKELRLNTICDDRVPLLKEKRPVATDKNLCVARNELPPLSTSLRANIYSTQVENISKPESFSQNWKAPAEQYRAKPLDEIKSQREASHENERTELRSVEIILQERAKARERRVLSGILEEGMHNSNSGMQTPRARASIPPERKAAAKKRLEQRSVERKRMSKR